MDDSEIIAAIAAGDQAGWWAAYDTYAAGLYSYCRWMLREPAHAADALRETFVAAAEGLGSLKDAGEARAWLYRTARAECLRRVRTAGASFDPRAEEQEAIELCIRHGLSEADVGSVLDMPRHQVHILVTGARDHTAFPSTPPLDHLPPALREQLLSAAVSAAPQPDEGIVLQVSYAGRASLRRLGRLLAGSRIRANPGVAAALTAVAVWAVAAMSATLLTLTGMHGSRPLATQTHTVHSAAASPPAGGTVSPSTEVSPSQSPRPRSHPTPRGVAPPTTTRPTTPRPSPTQPSSPSASASPSSSASPSPSPSLSPSASATPTPTASG